MKSLKKRIYFDSDEHELFKIEKGDDFSMFPWRIRYEDNPEIFFEEGIDLRNYYWLPVKALKND